MPALHTYRVFISHAWKYSDDYNRIVQLLNNASNFSWQNYSVPEHDPLDGTEDLKEGLRKQIRPVQIVVILAGMYVNYSDWIEFEMAIDTRGKCAGMSISLQNTRSGTTF